MLWARAAFDLDRTRLRQRLELYWGRRVQSTRFGMWLFLPHDWMAWSTLACAEGSSSACALRTWRRVERACDGR